MSIQFDFIFSQYVNKLASPDGRETYESLPSLISRIIDNAKIKPSNVIIDMGSGWGNVTIECAKLAKKVIGIEPNAENLAEAQKRIQSIGINNIELIKGSFEKPNYKKRANTIISSLVLHQIANKNKQKALSKVNELLTDNGTFILCDTIMLFNPNESRELFDKIYRYLIEKTTPTVIYENHIKKYFEDNDYVYSWEDMKKYTPQKYWYYCLSELEVMLDKSNMKIVKTDPISPFFRNNKHRQKITKVLFLRSETTSFF